MQNFISPSDVYSVQPCWFWLTAYICFNNRLCTFCAGTVRYASNDILFALSAEAQPGQVQIQRQARHDLVAFVKSFWAIQWERADQLNQIHASDVEVICSQYCPLCEHATD